ncbi:MAG: tyrosyl-tRNA synthetase [Mycoplasmataceae bacterium RC_NB112A]|nr:MAG: tyrosyl-tRNA synthetase [Mycoplasmataceae bacterium RC_NB112A]KLL01900.1 MAG: tyrosyl-tRNA synthetase [Mycoplasmataceae bacterium RC_NB112A]
MSTNFQNFFQELQKRGIIANYANLDNFYHLEPANLDNFYHLEPEERVVYLGVDCTSESLHIGHLFLYFQAIRFAKEEFTVLLILGGATSKIGDPSDKDKERPLLVEKDIEDYQNKIKSQLEKILIEPKKIEEVSFSPLEQFYSNNPKLLSSIHQVLKINEIEKGKQWEKYLQYIWPENLFCSSKKPPFQILNNQSWLEKINFIDFLRQTGKYLTIAYLSNKETTKKRIETGLSFLEFSYPLIQAYDFCYLYKNYNCHGQLGGSDQWGNLTTGLKLIRSIYPQNKTFAFNFPLLTDKEGKKYSKSEKGSNVLRLDSNQKEFCDFWRNLPDEQAKIYALQFTFLREEQINKLLELNNPPRLRILQRILYELIHFLSFGKVGKIV